MQNGEIDRARYPYKMKDLCEKTGVPRQVVHFYILSKLVPEGFKTGRNMAYYGDEHVERIRLVRQLQHERFLPLKAIRAVLEQRDEIFSPSQRAQLAEVRNNLRGTTLRAPDQREVVAVEEVLSNLGIERQDFLELVSIGLLAVVRRHGSEWIAQDTLWILELWAEIRSAGFTEALGFCPRDLILHEEAVSGLIQQETRLLAERLSQIPPEDAARMLERIIPMISTFLGRYHASRARDFFAAIE